MLSVTAGMLVRKQIRNFLKRLEFKGYEISFHESKGFLESEFLIRCDDKLA